MKNIGIIISIHSDFQMNDINFAFTNLKNNKIYHHIRSENNNKVLLENIPGGQYELLIYAHSCLSNVDRGGLQSIDANFLIDIHFLKWDTESDDFQQHFIMVDVDGSSYKFPMESVDKSLFQCFKDYQVLPTELKSFNSKFIEINSEFMIPVIEEYDHIMEYTPESG